MRAGLQFAFVFATTALVACDQGTKPKTSDPEPSAADQREPLIIVTERTATSDESTTRTVERLMEFKHAMCACKNAACAERILQTIKKSDEQKRFRISDADEAFANGLLRDTAKCMELVIGASA